MRFREVADPVTNEATQIALIEAQVLNPEAEIAISHRSAAAHRFWPDRRADRQAGDRAARPRRGAQRQYNEFKDRVGEIVNGLVKRAEFGNVVVDLGRAEAMLRRDELRRAKASARRARARLYLRCAPGSARPQIFLSRTHPQFMAKLFAQEVPEIYDAIIEIKAVARDPGSRAKDRRHLQRSGIDPVGACVGMRGSRVQAVVAELQGEKIDIIPWSGDPPPSSSMRWLPAEVAKVVMDEEQRRIEVVVPRRAALARHRRRGQNVRLASQLTGWDIDILNRSRGERAPPRANSAARATPPPDRCFIEALDASEPRMPPSSAPLSSYYPTGA